MPLDKKQTMKIDEKVLCYDKRKIPRLYAVTVRGFFSGAIYKRQNQEPPYEEILPDNHIQMVSPPYPNI